MRWPPSIPARRNCVAPGTRRTGMRRKRAPIRASRRGAAWAVWRASRRRLERLLAAACLLGLSQAAPGEDIDLFAGVNSHASANPTLMIAFDNNSNGRSTVQGQSKLAIAQDAMAAAIEALTDATGQIN